jgi:hypothetical protein
MQQAVAAITLLQQVSGKHDARLDRRWTRAVSGQRHGQAPNSHRNAAQTVRPLIFPACWGKVRTPSDRKINILLSTFSLWYPNKHHVSLLYRTTKLFKSSQFPKQNIHRGFGFKNFSHPNLSKWKVLS